MSLEQTEIAVRAFVKPKAKKSSYIPSLIEIPNYSRVLTLDTETTTDQYQNLRFGYYRIDDSHIKVDYGIFYDPKFVNQKELKILKKICDKVISVSEFVDDIFLPEVYDVQTLCVGFNLPFDLSRLAIGFGYGRKSNRESFSFQLSENKKYPRLIIKSLDSTKSFIRFGTSKLTSRQYQGNFLDLRTLSFSLSSKKHTLESACKFFESSIKKHHSNEHGKITLHYVKYNINDVDATYSLYLRLAREYEKYGLSKQITRIYSPASIGKAFLEDMGILPFDLISKVSPHTLGLIMTSYFGGRTEVRIRKQPELVKYLDFLSMYPTVCILLNLWRFVIAKNVIEENCVQWTRDFLEKISLENLQDPKIWKKFSVIVCLSPDSDILPSRSKYGHKHAYNIGINHISYNGKLWYCLPDIIASKLLCGKAPKIVNAVRFVPVGIQENLKQIKIFGEQIDPVKEDFFKKIIEKRQELKDNEDSREHILKIIANSTSYGIYAQINTISQSSESEIFGLDHFTTRTDKTEKIGERYNPILSSLITSGSRLILAIVESILAQQNSVYAFCDTDSMAVPVKFVDIIQQYFQKLNPYNFDKPLFKLEKENFVDGKETDLLFYGISSKRYVLYNIVDDKIVIRKHSSHGLGHINNPFPKSKDWEKEFWTDILEYHYSKKTRDEINLKYSNHYATSTLSISTPNMLRRFKKLNKDKPFEKQIKSFNFCIVGFRNMESVKPLSIYRKNSQEAVFDEFIDYETGKIMSGIQYWKDLKDIFWEYLAHPEAKFDGITGILKRKKLMISNIVTIGKESNQIDESEILGLDDQSYLTYGNHLIPVQNILKLTPKQAKIAGIGKNQLYRIKKAITNNRFNPRKKTLEKLWMIK